MKRIAGCAGLVLFVVLAAGCGSEPAATDTPEPPPAKVSPDLLVGTWDYGMKYPSGDEIAMVRVMNADGSGLQYDKESGESAANRFTWKLSEDGKKLDLSFGEAMVSYFEVVEIAEGKHVLKNPHGIDETYTKR